jgi:hypothetical protein
MFFAWWDPASGRIAHQHRAATVYRGWKPLPQSYNTAVKSKSVVEVLTNNKISPNSNLQRCKRVWDLVVCILKFI